ncbi:PLASTID MOVEMENT IMPAIRED PROTEIN [Salix purpurea]|uniref:PLASTID MOVEMENT IMPAIRED PROTEIN n=1 Tax=Salix purpurea TaxID=77065 RepID=A0A9Q0ZHT4_SALPP|nr:PLASTID MOVEMENT IMPAIRED PROTEIN [Salix purpurea]
MGNNLGGGRKAKVMKINGETFKLKTPARAGDVVKDYPGYVLLDSEAVKHFGIRAKPLEPQQELKAKKVYFLRRAKRPTGTNSVRVKVRLPKAQVQKLVEESRNEVEVAEKIIGLYMDNSGEAKGEHDPSRNWQPELGSITESFKATEKRVSFVPEEGEIRLAVASH